MTTRPTPIRTDASNAFAHYSMHTRVPAILREAQTLNPDYAPSIMAALERLSESIQKNAPIPPLELPAPDYDDWASLYAEHPGQTWLDAEWFYAEVYVYRQVLQAVRYHETGRDPFAPKKDEELHSAALWERLELAMDARELPPAERLIAALKGALWGNRADLSYAVGLAHGTVGTDADLISDDSAAAAARLLELPGDVHLVADNFGSEMAVDLALIDALIGLEHRVTLHLKAYPTFVSDATVADVNGFLRLMASGEHGKSPRKLATSLRKDFAAGRLRLSPDAFWDSARFGWELPRRLAQTFSGARLIIFKGDANYRRLTGDAIWPPETPFAQAVDYLPAPALVLRTLKSDSVVGLPPGIADQLDTTDKDWRISGRRGLIQFSDQGSDLSSKHAP